MVLSWLSASTTAADGVKSATRYYGFDGQTVAVRDKNGLGGVTSLVGDPHGTTLAAIPNTRWAANSVVKQYTDPFGAARGTAASIPGDRQFLDKTRDTATGLTMVGARYYDEANGRFISVDPLLDLADPQQWNAYAYANNNPTTLSDPSGLTPRIDDDYDGGRGPLAKRGPAPSTPPSTARAADPAAVNGVCDAAWVAAHPPPKKPLWQRVLGYAAVATAAVAGATFCTATATLGCLAIAAGATAAVSFGNNWAIQEQPAGQAATGAAIDGALMFAGGTLAFKGAESFAAASSLSSSGLGSAAGAGSAVGSGAGTAINVSGGFSPRGLFAAAGTRVRPSGIPEGWRVTGTKGPGGVLYSDPTNPGNAVRVMQGSPSSPFVNSRAPYVRWQRNGHPLDESGNVLPSAKVPEAHIPLSSFRFRSEVFGE